MALAGAIIALSALRVGAAVQVTLWSGARRFETTHRFVRDPVQVLIVSDDGVTTMFDEDERGGNGWDISVVRNLEELVPFARDFSLRHYAREARHAK